MRHDGDGSEPQGNREGGDEVLTCNDTSSRCLRTFSFVDSCNAIAILDSRYISAGFRRTGIAQRRTSSFWLRRLPDLGSLTIQSIVVRGVRRGTNDDDCKEPLERVGQGTLIPHAGDIISTACRLASRAGVSRANRHPPIS